MARAVLTPFVCSACGRESARWLGRCAGCGEWNSLVEAPAALVRTGRPGAVPARVGSLAAVALDDSRRISTGLGELDRVLGGGIVPGSLILLAGEPGVGKSSLLLQSLHATAAGGHEVLLVSGEESPAQVRLRAERLGAVDGVRILAETDVDVVCQTLDAERPAVCVVDSVQTLHTADAGSTAGSVSQVRESAARLLRLAKETGVAVILVGHVTKEGSVAGPRVLEHLVDCVLQFEGDRYRYLRVLRAVKNRFGSTDEIGIFEMTDGGLAAVLDPSAMFAAAAAEPGPGSVLLPAIEGTRPILLEVQALVAPSDLAMPRRSATGFDRNRLSMITAVLGRHSGVALGTSDVYVNVAGGVRVDEPAADLAVAVAIVSAHRGRAVEPAAACFGELGLTGRLRPVSQAARRLEEAAKLGVVRAVAPPGTPSRGGVDVAVADTLEAALRAAFADE
ncbi:MAG TPA: DNA repair protein RadA [Gaiellales bacterium]|nr:DNA repair protein RadA [Gaiellales bacterium]